jgi:hypothetical protein
LRTRSAADFNLSTAVASAVSVVMGDRGLNSGLFTLPVPQNFRKCQIGGTGRSPI